MAVKMLAQRSGPCRRCDHPIRVGDPIEWSRSRGAWHRDCQAARLAHAKADADARRTEALRQLRAAFESAPEVAEAPPRTHVLESSFLGWVTWACVTDAAVILRDVVKDPQTLREQARNRSLPRTEALFALVVAATY